MRTNIDANVTISTVFGFGQDRAVATRIDETCAYAAQHLSSWHAGKHDRSRAYKRSGQVVRAGADRNAWPLRLAVTGPQRQPVRLMSPELVMA